MKEVQIKQISKQDLNQARRFAAEGMNLSRYVSNKIELYLYSSYVLYHELSKSTIALGAYFNSQLVGFLFARFRDGAPIFKSRKQKLFISLGKKIISMSSENKMAEMYDLANKEMFNKLSMLEPDGEITFFAADPELKGKGIGSLLLNELELIKKGKHVYLYTDSECNYPFYLKKGFEIFDSKEIMMESRNGKIPLTCYIMHKKL